MSNHSSSQVGLTILAVGKVQLPPRNPKRPPKTAPARLPRIGIDISHTLTVVLQDVNSARLPFYLNRRLQMFIQLIFRLYFLPIIQQFKTRSAGLPESLLRQ